jgi:hypothetical protein
VVDSRLLINPRASVEPAVADRVISRLPVVWSASRWRTMGVLSLSAGPSVVVVSVSVCLWEAESRGWFGRQSWAAIRSGRPTTSQFGQAWSCGPLDWSLCCSTDSSGVNSESFMLRVGEARRSVLQHRPHFLRLYPVLLN